jgi:hypothetical protein
VIVESLFMTSPGKDVKVYAGEHLERDLDANRVGCIVPSP